MQETIRIADGALEERLGHKFLTIELLARALTHSSAVPELRAAGTEETVSALFPRNSSRSLFPGNRAETVSSVPAARSSGTAELWVSALARSSIVKNLCPRRSSSAPSAIRIVSCITPPHRRPGSLRRAQLRRAKLLRIFGLSLARPLQGPRHRCALVKGRDRIIEVRGALVRHSQ